MNCYADVAGQQALRIQQYLLQGPVQQRSGANCGAVAGIVKADGDALYVYGEITGYYLHWLASLPEKSTEAMQAAQMAVDWLARYLQASGGPRTRIYLRDEAEDWRNDAVFFFDLAMVAGGLARVENAGLVSLPASIVADLQRWLYGFVADGTFKVCMPRSSDIVLPQRWSTVGGPFTAKTASRVLLLGNEVALDESLLRVCRRQLQAIARQADSNGLDMIHPTLYAIEGCLLSPDADLERLAAWFDQIVALRDASGILPESAQTPHVHRLDVIAQSIRVGIFLETLLRQPGRYREVCHAFAETLLKGVREDGSVGFSTGGNADANVWATMFSEQALRLYSAYVRGQQLPFRPEALV